MGRIKGTVTGMILPGAMRQVDDFAISVSSKTPSAIGLSLCAIWLTGIFAMLLLVIKSSSRLRTIKRSALPLQNNIVRILYQDCLNELGIKKNIPVYGTAFLKSPVIAGLFRPCIYLPIHLISDFHADAEKPKEILGKRFNAADMRYILLHELQHYRYKDAFVNFFINLFGVLYWFNPMVWFTLKEMRSDREIACDTSVLQLLKPSDYKDYGNTLINFAEKISLTPFSFASFGSNAAGISGTMKQMQKRILNISSYKKPSVWKKIKGAGIFALIAVILFGLAPENVNAVKNSICLFSNGGNFSLESTNFYGKTGTGRVDGQDVNGWFVGYIENADNTYFFATNIQSTENATGSKASEISLAILSGMGIWKQ